MFESNAGFYRDLVFVVEKIKGKFSTTVNERWHKGNETMLKKQIFIINIAVLKINDLAGNGL